MTIEIPLSMKEQRTRYDGVDSNRDDFDYDQDGDGEETLESGGTDCMIPIQVSIVQPLKYGMMVSIKIVMDSLTTTKMVMDRSSEYGGPDCNDLTVAVYYGAAETWYDGVDQNCDGFSDYDQDGDGQILPTSMERIVMIAMPLFMRVLLMLV